MNADDQAWVDAKSTPHPLASLRQPLHLTGVYRAVSHRAFIYAVGLAEEARYQEFSREPGCLVRGIDGTGHDIMVDRPEALADALADVAAEAMSSSAPRAAREEIASLPRRLPG